ncbi:MAG: hypothetical protein J3Q66DRAFT_340461, partial [Benniella sp.]
VSSLKLPLSFFVGLSISHSLAFCVQRLFFYCFFSLLNNTLPMHCLLDTCYLQVRWVARAVGMRPGGQPSLRPDRSTCPGTFDV